MVWALVFVLVTTSVAESWDTGLRFSTLEECRQRGSALAAEMQNSHAQRFSQRATGEIQLTDWEWSCLPAK